MRGDFSRLTFRPGNHYSGVRLQQGRVQLDAEFNEHVDIEAYRDRETARDVIGPAGTPLDGGGFRVGTAAMLRGVAAPGAAWAVGEDGTVLRAAAGAGTWTLEPRPPGSGRLNAVGFVDDASGWAVGDGAAIYRLEVGAAAGVPVPTGVTADLHGVHAASGSAAWAVGSRGMVLGYDGTAWKRQAAELGVTAALRSVHAGGVTCAVGDAGTIIATGAGGTGWRTETAPPDTGDLYGVFVRDATHRWAVGEQGTILFSNGTAWSRQHVTPALTRTLRAVVFTSATAGTAVGDGGTVVTTSDGGATWTRHVVPNLTADLRDVVARPDGALLAVGDDVTLARGGGVWALAPQLPADRRTLVLSAGDIYVEGIRCENGRTVSLAAQPEPRLAGLYRNPGGAGTFGVYLQVQEQHLTAVEREELKEVALGGPDTATRTRTVWQADLVKVTGATPTCADVTAAVRPQSVRGRLRARAKPAAVTTSSCIVPPSGGYERLENQLYRVEIHRPSGPGGPNFKWSRDNGSMVARLQRIDTKAATAAEPAVVSLTVSQMGRDATLGFGPDQFVEITDEGRMLRGDPGVLAEVGEIDGNTLILENVDAPSLTMADFPDRPLVRRWDGRGDATTLPIEHELESGVFVAFEEGPDTAKSFRTGDYWTIPARTLNGAVEWPSEGGLPTFEASQGPEAHFAPLALVTLGATGVWSDVRDCRKLFPTLSDLVHMHYVGGDGQVVTAPVPPPTSGYVTLGLPLQVAVFNGGRPVVGAPVQFDLKAGPGAGRLRALGGDFDSDVTVLTGADGIATCQWELDGTTPTQVVRTRLGNASAPAPRQVVYFSASLNVVPAVTPAARVQTRTFRDKVPADDFMIVEFGAGSERFDTDGLFDPGNPTRLRASRHGTYLATAEVAWGEGDREASRSLELYFDKTSRAKVRAAASSSQGELMAVQQVTTITRMLADDYVELAAVNESKQDAALDAAVLSLAWLGPTVGLELTLGEPASFGALTPGIAKEYTANATANVFTTAANTTLSISPDPLFLTNGAFQLAQPLRVKFAPETWAGSGSHEVSIVLTQPVGVNDALRTGTYRTTVPFTLSDGTSSTTAELEVSATIGSALKLSVGAPASFGSFSPAVARTYTASTTAHIVTTAASPSLSVSGPKRLQNGDFQLAQPVQFRIVTPGAWPAPGSHDVTIVFEQPIAANDALLAGAYSTTLTLTLSDGVSSTSQPLPVTATVARAVGLTLSSPADFGRIAANGEFHATTTALVFTTADDTTLSNLEVLPLTNDTHELAQRPQIQTSPATWAGPVSNAEVKIDLTQQIGRGEDLVRGPYKTEVECTLAAGDEKDSKTLTLTARA